MNNNRLSSANLESVDRTWLVSEVDKLLEKETLVCNLSMAGSENTLETESTLDESSYPSNPYGIEIRKRL